MSVLDGPLLTKASHISKSDTGANLANGVATRRRIYDIILLLSGIELRGDGGTNGRHESRGLKLT